MKKILISLLFYTFSLSIISFLLILIFNPIFKANSLIFPFAINPFDICKDYPEIWKLIKKLYCISFCISYTIVFSFIYYNKIIKYNRNNLEIDYNNINSINNINFNKSKLNLLIGQNLLNEKMYIPENGLYQNILITGTIGSR